MDSLKAFREIDEKEVQIENATKVLQVIAHMENEDEETSLKQVAIEEVTETFTVVTSDPLDENNRINWQQTNETTPHRKKRNLSTIINEEESYSSSSSSSSSLSPKHKRLASLDVRRTLFSDNFSPKTKYPKKGVYKLGNIYERIFKMPAENLHRAESDVAILTKLILHYGLDFLAYAEERKQSFNKVPKLGASTN